MSYKKLNTVTGVLVLIFVLSITAVNAQPVTNIPVTTIESSPAPTDASTTGQQNPSVTLGKKPLNPGQLKKRTRQEIISDVSQKARNAQTKANHLLSVLDAIWARVQSRIDKFKAAGKDMSGLAGWIQQVEIKRKAAADSIATGSANINQIPTPATAKNKGRAVVTQFRTAKRALKDYHQAIVTVIKNLRGMSANTGVGPSVIPSATKTPSATPSGSVTISPTNVPVTVTAVPT